MKININFPVYGDTRDDCLKINDILVREANSVIRFGPTGNSSPHVTLLMGDIEDIHISRISEDVCDLARTLPRQISADFGQAYREAVTGRYIFSDVSVPNTAAVWRSQLCDAVSKYFVSRARMTEEGLHLTLGVLEAPTPRMDAYLEEQHALRSSIFSRIHISLAGSKGAKLDVLSDIEIS
jgi:hypothetical protein